MATHAMQQRDVTASTKLLLSGYNLNVIFRKRADLAVKQANSWIYILIYLRMEN